MLTYKDLIKINRFCESLHSEPEWREVVDCIDNDETDFEIDNVRFIRSDIINEVLAEELSNDEYILGCFMPYFVADQTNVDSDVIKAMQEAEAFEAVGKLILSLCDMGEFAQAYASADGYGHHFNSYDFGEEELTLSKSTVYHVFDNHN